MTLDGFMRKSHSVPLCWYYVLGRMSVWNELFSVSSDMCPVGSKNDVAMLGEFNISA